MEATALALAEAPPQEAVASLKDEEINAEGSDSDDSTQPSYIEKSPSGHFVKVRSVALAAADSTSTRTGRCQARRRRSRMPPQRDYI